MTKQEYDSFLATVKGGRFKRTGNWGGMKQTTEHQCTDSECGNNFLQSENVHIQSAYGNLLQLSVYRMTTIVPHV